MPSLRIAKVNEFLHRTFSEALLREVELPPGVFVTVSYVETSRDLEHAKIFLTVLPDDRRATALQAIQRRLPHLQHVLASKIRTRTTPKLELHFDSRQIKAQHLYDTLDHLTG